MYNLQNIRWKRRSSLLINICWYIFLISTDKIYLYLQKLLLKINPIILLVNNNNCYFFKRNFYNKVFVTMNSVLLRNVLQLSHLQMNFGLLNMLFSIFQNCFTCLWNCSFVNNELHNDYESCCLLYGETLEVCLW